MYRHRHRGEKSRLAASEINLWNQSAVDLQSLRKVLTTSEREQEELAWTVPVRNDTANQLAIGSTMALGAVIMPLNTDDTVDLVFAINDVASHDDIPCVLIEPIRPGFVGRAVVAGVAKALVDGTSFVAQRFARPMVGNLLEPSAEGSIRLLDSPAAGVSMVPVVLGTSSPGGEVNLFRFQLTSDLAATALSTATALFANATTGTVINSGSFRAFTDAEGMAIEAGGNIFIVHINQRPLRIYTTLGPRSGSGVKTFAADPREPLAKIVNTTLQSLTPYPFSHLPTLTTDIPNPHELFGESGDGCILAWDPGTEAYFLEEVFPAKQQTFWAEFTADRPNGLNASMQVRPLAPASDGLFTGSTIEVIDRFNVAINAKADHKLLAQWDADNKRYIAVESEHITTHLQGYVKSYKDNTPADFDVTVTVAFNGIMPNPVDIVVKNRFKWIAVGANDVVEVFWDTMAGEWYAVQCECPDDFNPLFF